MIKIYFIIIIAGIRGLEVVAPEAVKRAARLFYRDGFVVVRDVLTPQQTERLRNTCNVNKIENFFDKILIEKVHLDDLDVYLDTLETQIRENLRF